MDQTGKKFICIHGHFYQPPRENAWLEVVEWQESAHPYHDWNERITAECYAPNTASRILDENGVIQNITNNYSRISFNFGPTLLSWLEENDTETYEAILQADRESMKLFGGHGSAIAQVYNHIIMPLASRRDKETQIIWGIRDFEHRFGRKPEGMWLSETAVDLETLDLLAAHDIRFTILAPHQAKAFRTEGHDTWTDLRPGELDTRRPYLCHLPSGRSIILFFYNGAIAQAVAFNALLNNGQQFAEQLIRSFDDNPAEAQIVHIATDGETYGHHHKHGDMALAYCLEYIQQKPDIRLTNYGQFIELFPPRYEVIPLEFSSWSCIHGVERWRDNCGCNTGKPGFHQHWRKPLREALDWLRDRLIELFEQQADGLLTDPWQARNEYIRVILKRNEENIRRFIKDYAQKTAQPAHILRLLETQRNAMLMYTSCGWFFDEVSGIESAQILQYACRAIQLVSQVAGADLEQEFMERLRLAPSNLPEYGDAGGVYRKLVLPSKITLQGVGMHYAVASLFEEDPENCPVFNYTTSNEFFLRKEAGEQRLVLGITRVRSNVTLSEKRFAFAAVYLGKHNLIGSISLDMEADDFASMQVRVVKAFEEARLADVISLMQSYFGPEHYTIWHLFKDEKRKVLNQITRNSLAELEESLRRVYNRDYPLMNALRYNQLPVPSAYLNTLAYILNADLTASFKSVKINLKKIERIMQEMATWKLNIEDPGQIARLAGERIFKELRSIAAERGNVRRLERLNRLFPLLRKFQLEPNLYKSQNLYFEISQQENGNGRARSEEWMRQFEKLGDNLGVKLRKKSQPLTDSHG